jgi:hypothetical protein
LRGQLREHGARVTAQQQRRRNGGLGGVAFESPAVLVVRSCAALRPHSVTSPIFEQAW